MRYLILFFLFCAASPAESQTQARNWTKTDCDGNSHTLFSELDSGNVVILDFAMTYMDQAKTVVCVPCSTATQALEGLHTRFEESLPGKVRHYAIAYVDNYDCAEMAKWKEQCKFSVPTVLKGANEVSYYGGMGMPTIVVVGPDHKIYYKKQGFVKKDTLAIKQAVATALGGTMSVSSEDQSSSISFSPNPTRDFSTIESKQGLIGSVALISELGVEVWRQVDVNAARITMPVNELPNGKYIVKVQVGEKTTQSSLIVNR